MINRLFPSDNNPPHQPDFAQGENLLAANERLSGVPLSNPGDCETPPASFASGVDCDNETPYAQRLDTGAIAYIPEHCEPNYPYPLVVWPANDTATTAEEQPAEFERRMRAISPRNVLGLQLPPVTPSKSARLEEVQRHVRRLRRSRHVHTERVFLAGIGGTAETALQLFLQRPEWFGGAVCLCGRFDRPLKTVIPFRNPELRGKRIFLSSCADDPQSNLSTMVQAGRLLHIAGLDICTRIVSSSEGSRPEMLSAVNAWLMEGVCATV